jgi:hypothetical protein
MEKLQKCVNFILTVPVFFATSCIYTIFFTVGSRNSTKISNFKNKKMMTNKLSSFDEFNGISSCLDNTIRFLSQQ